MYPDVNPATIQVQSGDPWELLQNSTPLLIIHFDCHTWIKENLFNDQEFLSLAIIIPFIPVTLMFELVVILWGEIRYFTFRYQRVNIEI